jgi:ABC-2 type transport system permease protein
MVIPRAATHNDYHHLRQASSGSALSALRSSTHNITRLMAFMLRCDRLWLPLWILACLMLATVFAPMLPSMIGSAQDIAILREAMSNPAMVAMCGIIYGESYTYGVMYAQFMLVFSALLVAAMNILFVVRHTRKDEEEGRLEMLVALPVGKNANLLATLTLSFAGNLLIALISGTIIAAFGVEGMGAFGSLLFGAALGVSGFIFAAITALITQVAASSRATLGIAFALLGATYLLRAVGDVAAGNVSVDAGVDAELFALISPFGLIERCHLFVDNHSWPLLVLFAASLVLAALAFILNAWRDSGAGLIAPCAGRAHASALLRGPWSLAWRLVRGTLIAWVLIVFIIAVAYGSVFGDMSLFYESNDLYRLMIGTAGVSGAADLMDPVVALLMLIMAVISAVPVVLVVVRLKSEEKRKRLELFYSGAVSRVYTLGGYALIALLLAFVLQLTTALGMWAAAWMSMDNPITLGLMLKTALNYLPAVLFMVGLAVFLVGALPQATVLTWLLLAYTFFAVYMGSLLGLPEWTTKLTPFGILPRYPVDDFEPTLAGVLCIVAIALAAIGLVAYRRRDLE